MKHIALILGLCTLASAHAQLDVPVHIELEGASPESRQVDGLASPERLDAAVSAEAARATTMSYALADGTNALSASLTPAPPAYTAGMLVTIVPSAANASGATLELNGLGARDIVKSGQVPLDSADLPANIPARLVYDGTRFLLLSNASRPCPVGSYAPSSTYCIQETSNTPGSFFEAVTICHDRGARLCTFAEWNNACRTRELFINTVSSYEWVDDGANHSNDGKVVGGGYEGSNPVPGFACNYGQSQLPTLPYRFRCCSSR